MPDIRHFIDIASTLFETGVDEAYSNENNYLRRYLADGEFDPYLAWPIVAEWIVNNGYLDDLHDTDGTAITDLEQLEECEAEIFYQLPDDAQKECAEMITNWMMQHDPAEAGSTSHFNLQHNKPLPRQTWLVHFSDDAGNIWRNGFQYGAEDMTRLGLTTHYTDKHRKSTPGYNFAFIAQGRDVDRAVADRKYGGEAVLFQSSGVRAYHYGDEEDQVIFWGPAVPKGSFIYMRNNHGTWQVVTNRDIRQGENSDVAFQADDFDTVVAWAIQHHQQYHRFLFWKR